MRASSRDAVRLAQTPFSPARDLTCPIPKVNRRIYLEARRMWRHANLGCIVLHACRHPHSQPCPGASIIPLDVGNGELLNRAGHASWVLNGKAYIFGGEIDQEPVRLAHRRPRYATTPRSPLRLAITSIRQSCLVALHQMFGSGGAGVSGETLSATVGADGVGRHTTRLLP